MMALVLATLPCATTRAAPSTFARAPSGADARFEIIDAPRNPSDVTHAAPRQAPTLLGMRGRRVLWGRLTLVSRSALPERIYVVPDRGWRKVTLFDGGRALRTGLEIPVPERAVPQGHPVIPLTLEPGTTRVVAMRFEGVLDGWEPPMAFLEAVEPSGEGELRRQHERLVLGVYAGLLLALTFVNLLFSRVLRDALFADYVLYAVPYASIWLSRDFIGAEAFWPSAPYLDNVVLFIVICASIVFGNRFAIRFLEMKTELPSFRRALFAVNGLVACVVALALLDQFRFVPSLLGLAALGTSVIYIVAGVRSALAGHVQGPIFAVATSVLALGTIVYTLADLRILPASPFTTYCAQIGSAIEMFLLAFALADRVRVSERDRRTAEVKLRDGLEREVEERTQQLEQINDKLIELNQQLEAQSLTDALTGIANRRRFEAALDDEWRRAQRERTPISLLLVDVDHFKPFNDLHGHPAGDECLRRVARVLSDGTRRASDLLARYGGEEFVIILPNTPADVALAHAERLREAIAAAPMSTGATPPRVTVSIGVATIDTADGEAKATLVAPADEALYRAKDLGRNRVVASEAA